MNRIEVGMSVLNELVISAINTLSERLHFTRVGLD
jgi:hypothetical protein